MGNCIFCSLSSNLGKLQVNLKYKYVYMNPHCLVNKFLFKSIYHLTRKC